MCGETCRILKRVFDNTAQHCVTYSWLKGQSFLAEYMSWCSMCQTGCNYSLLLERGTKQKKDIEGRHIGMTELREQEAKGKFLTNVQCFPPSPPAAPTPLTPLQPCSELAGVFLYKRPILWDARIAMEAFEGHHTKAQRQRGRLWYPDQFPNCFSDFIIQPVV